MISEAIDKILGLAQIKTIEVDDRTYCDRNLHVVRRSHEATPETIELHSLIGVVEFVNSNSGRDLPARDKLIIHVVNERRVKLLGQMQPNNFNERFCYVRSGLGHPTFDFGTWLDQEDFIIQTNTYFQQDEMRDGMLKLASSMKKEDSEHLKDDGVSQSVTVRTGIRLGEEMQIPPFTLRPFRTFREIKQPASEFRLRVRQSPLRLALFEADGGLWRLRAIDLIKEFFTELLPDVAVFG
jgi:hypothetical protein